MLLLLAAMLLAFEMRGADTRRDWIILWTLVLPLFLFGARLLTEFLSPEQR